MRACVRAVRGWGHPGHGPTRRPVHTPARGPTARNVLLVLVVRYYHRRVPVRGPRDLSVHATPRRAARFHRLLFNAKGAPRESERRGRAGTVGGYSQRYRARTTTAASRSRQRGRCRHLSRAHATASNVVARPPRSLARLPPNVPSSPVPLGVFFFSLSLKSVCNYLIRRGGHFTWWVRAKRRPALSACAAVRVHWTSRIASRSRRADEAVGEILYDLSLLTT